MKYVLTKTLPTLLLIGKVTSFSSLPMKTGCHGFFKQQPSSLSGSTTSKTLQHSSILLSLKNNYEDETEETAIRKISIEEKTTNSSEHLKLNPIPPDQGQRQHVQQTDLKPNETSESLVLPLSNEISNALLSPQVEILDTFLVLSSSLFVALGTLPADSIPHGFDSVIIFVEDYLTYIFGFAFFLRWYGVGKLSLEYLTKPLAILDIFVSVIPLISIFPGFGFINIPISMLPNSALVNLRLLRILRLSRVLTDLETFGRFEIALGLKPSDVKSYQLELAKVLLSIFTLVSVATGLIYSAEHQYNPQIPDYFTALYFGLTTLTTVGFGDITPVTFNGRLVVMASILFGVAVIPAQAARLFEALLEFQEERRQNQAANYQVKSSMIGNDDDEIIKESELQNAYDERIQEGKLLDPRISCKSCGARCHRVDAIYCCLCGEKLF